MAPKPQASKEAKAIAAANSSKGKKKKWSKGKMKEKVNNLVLFDKATYDKLNAEVPKYKLITPSVMSDRLRVNGSLARAAIRELAEKGMIRAVAHHGSQAIYTRATNVEEEVTKDKKPKKGATADKAEKPEKGATADKAAKPEAEKADKAEKAEA